ncbi:MAG: DNA polymerase III subunit delta, partial [Chloroflexi bacterium RBG_13_57_8]
MLHVLIGEDDYSLHQAIEDIKKGIGELSALVSNTAVFDGKTVTPEQLRNACETVPFLAEKRLVIVEGLFERFETGRKSGGKKAPRRVDQAEEIKKWLEIAGRLPPFTELVLTGGNIRLANPLLRELSGTGRVRSFPVLKEAQLRQWVERRVKDAGGAISPPAVAAMVRFVGSDLWSMANEVNKLVLYTAGRRVEEADVKAVVSHAREESVFTLVDAVLEFRGGTAQETLQQLLRQGEAPLQLLAMIARQARIILLVKEMQSRGKSPAEMQVRLGLNSDFLVRKAREQSEKYSPARLHELYHRL